MSLIHRVLARCIKSSFKKGIQCLSYAFVAPGIIMELVFSVSAVALVNALIPAPSSCVVAAMVVLGHGQDGLCT